MRISPYICPARSAGHLTVSAVRSHSRIYLPSVSILPRCTCLCTSIFYKILDRSRRSSETGQADPRRLSLRLRRGASWAARARARARRAAAAWRSPAATPSSFSAASSYASPSPLATSAAARSADATPPRHAAAGSQFSPCRGGPLPPRRARRAASASRRERSTASCRASSSWVRVSGRG